MPTFDTACWEWDRARTKAGYGLTQWDGRAQYVHRLVMDAPKGMVVDHLCRNPACYNPRHLEIVTDYENRARGLNRSAHAMRTNHCINGHPFTVKNTYVKPNGTRSCRECGRVRHRKYMKERCRADVSVSV